MPEARRALVRRAARLPRPLPRQGPGERLLSVPGPAADRPRLADALPTLTGALRDWLRRAGENALAEQLDDARIHATCSCGQPSCLSVYLAPRRDGPCDAEYRAVLPAAVVSLGVCGGRLEYIEDDAAMRDASDTEARRREYAALEGTVPSRSPAR